MKLMNITSKQSASETLDLSAFCEEVREEYKAVKNERDGFKDILKKELELNTVSETLNLERIAKLANQIQKLQGEMIVFAFYSEPLVLKQKTYSEIILTLGRDGVACLESDAPEYKGRREAIKKILGFIKTHLV